VPRSSASHTRIALGTQPNHARGRPGRVPTGLAKEPGPLHRRMDLAFAPSPTAGSP
jgi:hypothetical protein